MSILTETKEDVLLDEILSMPYVIILHNDDHNTFDHVIECLMALCKHSYEQASQCAFLVHHTGKCDVKRGEYETLQKIYGKLKSAGLTATMEMV